MTRTDSERAATAKAVREHRARTDNDYGRRYGQATRLAIRRLIARHPDEHAMLVAQAREEVGL